MQLAMIPILLIGLSQQFSISGLYPKEYTITDKLDVFAGELTSSDPLLKYNYYHLDFCTPPDSEITSEHVSGLSIAKTPYLFKQTEQEGSCRALCEKQYQGDMLSLIKWKIDRNYSNYFYVDDLPSAYEFKDKNKTQIGYEKGIPIGYIDIDGKYFIYNHLKFTVNIKEIDESKKFYIIGFKVQPQSIKSNVAFCASPEPQELIYMEKIAYTYEVEFLETEVLEATDAFQAPELVWAARWDHYFRTGQDQVHWKPILNSFLVVLCLAILIAHIMSKALKRDIVQYEQMRLKQQEKLKMKKRKIVNKGQQYSSVSALDSTKEEDEEKEVPVKEEFVLDEIAWKKVKGDVFRKPKMAMLFSVLIGTGIQIFAMIFFFLVCAVMGFISPAHRGNIAVFLYILSILLSNLSGYYTARFYKMFQGSNWLVCTLFVSFAFPTFVFIIFSCINFANWLESTSAVVSFPTIIVFAIIYCLMCIPNVWLGSFIGFKKTTVKNPGKINKLSRDIPPQPWHLRMKLLVPLGGLFPFAAMFMEFFYIMSSIWRQYFVLMFGFLFLILCILAITSAEIAIVQTYFQLCAENYQWWWRSFFISGSSGLYLFIFSLYYYCTYIQSARFSSIIIYFSGMLLISVSFTLMTGTIGFLASFTFNRKIYSMIKGD